MGVAVFGAPANGIVKRGRSLLRAMTGSLTSRDSMRIGSFSDRISVEVQEGGDGAATKGLSVRSGMFLAGGRYYD